MARIAFVFAGQGAQAPGMGRSLAEASPAAAEVFRRVDALRPGTSAQCFEGTQEELMDTVNTQPCLWAVELAAAAALTEAGVQAEAAAGFSLGELAALRYANAVDFETGFTLVCRRAELMAAAANGTPSFMAAVLKLDAAAVEHVCEAFDNAEAKAMLVNGVLEKLPRCFLVAASGMAGMGTPNAIRTRRVMKRFYLCGDEVSGVSDSVSLVAPRVMLCAAHQAQTVLRIIAGEFDV